MSWARLRTFRDRSAPKLHALARAERRGLEVAPAWHSRAEAGLRAPAIDWAAPWIVRSARYLEDREDGSRAGQSLSLVVEESDPVALGSAVDAVASDVLAAGGGHLFVQPLITGERGGVAFFDGWWFERTETTGRNEALTGWTERGSVTRGHLGPGDEWSRFLRRTHRALRGLGTAWSRLDIEWRCVAGKYVLLQARPALFEIRRNPVLSLANHREILGDVPSPWIQEVLAEAGARSVAWFARADPEIARWGESYAVQAQGRSWLNASVFYRMMDRWGLPRAMVSEGVGGDEPGPEERRGSFARMLLRSPSLIRLQVQGMLTILSAPRRLRALAARLARAGATKGSLDERRAALFEVGVEGLGLALATNFALAGALSGLNRLRGRAGGSGVVTRELSVGWEEIRSLPAARRPEALDRWLSRQGHRGPLESDPAQPRFAELRAELEADLEGAPTASHAPAPPPVKTPVVGFLERRRERFRDDLMRIWAELRAELLCLGQDEVDHGFLEAPSDVFLFGREQPDPAAAQRLRQRQAEARRRTPPLVTTLDALDAPAADLPAPDARSFPGIGLGAGRVQGQILRAEDLRTLLERLRDPCLDPARRILLAPALEPAWGLVFGRFAGVVAEIGGELSHASILLREHGGCALVNCRGSWPALADGESVVLDASRQVLERIDAGAEPSSSEA